MSDASMSPALINADPEHVLGYSGDDDDDTATRNESPPVTTPADHDVHPPTKPDPADPVEAVDPVPSAPAVIEAPADHVMADPPAKRELDDAAEPAAKRPRSNGPTPAPITEPIADPLSVYTVVQEPPPPPYTGPTLLSSSQHKFCVSTVRALKRNKDAAPFLYPVDPVALNIPHYPSVIKRPMDFATIEARLASSNPNKAVELVPIARYRTTDDFVSDVRQIFQNCYLFNGPEHFISHQARRLEDMLDRQLKQMPADEEPPRVESPVPRKPTVPPARRQSTSVPTIRRNTPDDYTPSAARPKREIHPPPPKDLPFSDTANAKRLRKGKGRGERDDGTVEQLRYCTKILQDFNKKSLYQVAGPFYEPVDVNFVPNYYKVIKKPMDLSTMRHKLDGNEYPSAAAFHNDFRQMMKNCNQFNPPGTAVYNAGLEMDRIFKEKWKNLPPLRQPTPEDEDDGETSEEERPGGGDTDLAIAMMESQIETIKDSLAALKAKKKKEKAKPAPVAPPPKEKKPPAPAPKKPVKKTSSYAPPTYQPSPGPSRSKEPTRRSAPPAKPPPKKTKGGAGSDTERSISTMSFEQKKELSTTIESLDGDKLEKVIQIIYEGMPDLQNSNEEIELDIESLTPAVLTKLWNFVVKPQQQKKAQVTSHGPKRTSGNASKGAAATGGVKRKSMDEEVESARIRKLQEQIKRFDPSAAIGGGETYDDDAHSSNGSGSESDSGSDSD